MGRRVVTRTLRGWLLIEGQREAENGPDRTRRCCPRCGGVVHRAHRRGHDRLVGLFRDVRRYRCTKCPWEGLLPVSPPTAGDGATRTGRTSEWRLGSALILIPAIALLLVWLIDDVREELRTPSVPAAGLRLDADDPRSLEAGATHELRRGCTWSGPEAAPYTGSFRDGLTSAGVPQDAVAKLELMHERGIASDRVTISSTGMESTDHRRHFSLTARAVAFDRTVCFTARIEIPPGASVTADLYEVVDAAGQRHAVVVVPQGGNIAIVEEQSRP